MWPLKKQEANPAPREISFCEDCRWFRSFRPTNQFGKCAHPASGKNGTTYGVVSRVVNLIEDLPYCSNVRSYANECGPYGRWFDARPLAPKKSDEAIALEGICTELSHIGTALRGLEHAPVHVKVEMPKTRRMS